MKKKNLYVKAYDHYSNLKLTLEQNLLDIKSMESNKNVQNILQEAVRTSENLKLNIDEFEMITDKLKEKGDQMKEAQDVISNYNQDYYHV